MDGQNFQDNNFQQVEAPKKTPTLAIVSLILGILAILTGCCFGWVGIILGIAGIICAILANKQGKTGLATAGLVCSIVGIVLGLVITVLAVIGVAMINEMGLSY